MFSQPAYEVKVVLVGDSAVGKSSILTRFVDDQFHDTLLSTIGVDFKFRRMHIDNEEVKLQIWDTAGQQTFRALVSAYYHSADAILIVYDITAMRTWDSVLEYWVKEAENNNRNGALLFVMGNKVDDQLSRSISTESVQQILKDHNIEKSFEVSAKTGGNVEESFVEIFKILKSKNKGKRHHYEQKANQEDKNQAKQQQNVVLTEASTEVKEKKCCLK